jgi:multidrug efflux pump subunit AcrA (membrane-fusion protein)
VKGRLFKGKISSISAILKLAAYDRAQKIAEVMLSLEENPTEDLRLLRPGMSAVASIQVGSFPKAIVIPLSSILERDGRSIVQVWNAEKKEFEWRDVLLATNDGLSAVIKQGLQANDKIRIKPKA